MDAKTNPQGRDFNLRYSFFGQKTAMFFSSGPPETEYWYLTFIRVKPDGSWEKIRDREGKTVKMNLAELVAFIDVLRGDLPLWKCFHGFNDQHTSIEIRGEGSSSDGTFAITVRVAQYTRVIRYPETRILLDLFEHTYHEKLIRVASQEPSSIGNEDGPKIQVQEQISTPHPMARSTVNPTPHKHSPVATQAVPGLDSKQAIESRPVTNPPEPESVGTVIPKNLENPENPQNPQNEISADSVTIHATFKRETEKAVLLEMGSQSGLEEWFPKSAIFAVPLGLKEGDEANFAIAEWLVKKKGLVV